MFLRDFNYQTFGEELLHGKHFFPCMFTEGTFIIVGLFISYQNCFVVNSKASMSCLFLISIMGIIYQSNYKAHITGN